MISQIILGGAQMSGFLYGGLKEPLDRKACFALWDAAWEGGVRFFDTAEGYGASADRLEDYLRTRKRLGDSCVSTKVTPGKGLGARISGAKLRFFGAKKVFTMTHGTVDGEAFRLCRQNVGQLLGQSVYSILEVAQAFKQGASFVQIPLGTFIQPIEVPCHVRSVFDAGRNVSDNPMGQIRSALDRLRPQDFLVVGIDTPAHLSQLLEAAQ